MEGELQFLTQEQSRAWASDRKYPLGARPYSVLADGPPFARQTFTIPSDAGARVALVRAIWSDVGSGQPEALLWVTDWSVWPSSEHMPLADAVRRGLGEGRPLSDAPGCLVRLGEDDQALAVLVTAVLFFGIAGSFPRMGCLRLSSRTMSTVSSADCLTFRIGCGVRWIR